MNDSMFRAIVDKHGADRILFGTDSPWSDQFDAITDIEKLGLPENARKKIMGENAERLLHI